MTQKTLTKGFDMRIIFAILAILIAIPYFYPLGLPLTLSRTTVAYAAVMEDLQPGDIIVISSDCTVGGLASVGGSIEVTLKYFVERGDVKIIIWGTHWDAHVVFQTVMAPILEDLEYGTQYVFFGYIPGAEVAVAKLADDILGILTTDFYGTPITDLSVMDGINDANDIDVLFSYDTWGSLDYYIGHWHSRYNSKIAAGILGQSMSVAEAQFAAKQLVGISGDARGAAELEQYLKIPGRASIITDTLSLSHMLVLILLAIGNIQYFLERSRGGK